MYSAIQTPRPNLRGGGYNDFSENLLIRTDQLRVSGDHETIADNTFVCTNYGIALSNGSEDILPLRIRKITGNVIMNKKIGLTFITRMPRQPRWRPPIAFRVTAFVLPAKGGYSIEPRSGTITDYLKAKNTFAGNIEQRLAVTVVWPCNLISAISFS